MGEIKVPFHKHLVRPTTRFLSGVKCGACWSVYEGIYGGYRCNEPDCDVSIKNALKPYLKSSTLFIPSTLSN
ncbi:hypothetical protein F2Q69_00017744 [Brassica cretica]|uniref:DC1 domain-containing protein n=2 Tax=Brassica cretica TaxID=69181 RepID=A0A8S9R669_BRACR|nr:hypothetical protein F2Q69_00017744 [Brassica cretica]KAF3580377.1 hypothetical protein DY000_02035704 [Brassica cretica]